MLAVALARVYIALGGQNSGVALLRTAVTLVMASSVAATIPAVTSSSYAASSAAVVMLAAASSILDVGPLEMVAALSTADTTSATASFTVLVKLTTALSEKAVIQTAVF